MKENDLWKYVDHGQIAILINRPVREFELERNKLISDHKSIYAYKYEDGMDVYKWVSDHSNRIPQYFINNLRRDNWTIYGFR